MIFHKWCETKCHIGCCHGWQNTSKYMCKPIHISFAFHCHFYFTSNAFYWKWRERNDLKAIAAASSLIMHWKFYNILSLPYIPTIVICKGRIIRLRVTWKDERKNYNFGLPVWSLLKQENCFCGIYGRGSLFTRLLYHIQKHIFVPRCTIDMDRCFFISYFCRIL